MTMPLLARNETLPVHQAQAGDPAAWDALYRRYQLPLYAFIQEMVRNEQLSLDLVQETFIRAVRYLGELRAPERFGSWLFGIAHQLVRRHARRSVRREDEALAELAELPDPYPEPDAWLIRREWTAAFLTALRELTPDHRAVFMLHYLEEFTVEEIATETGVRVGTVKSRLHYARKKLRELLEASDD
jgi:RNA polymerase sigma-70 factor, ECF subfamily